MFTCAFSFVHAYDSPSTTTLREQVYDAPSNTPGIIVSVFFWVSLTTLGFAVRRSKD